MKLREVQYGQENKKKTTRETILYAPNTATDVDAGGRIVSSQIL